MLDNFPAENINVSIVIPCLNEEKTLGKCIEAARLGIKKAGITGEIILSDNGSTDESLKIAHESGARVVECNKKGYGNALRAGFTAASGEWIFMGDSDLSYDFSELPIFMEKIKENYDLVMGTRFRGKIQKGAMPFLNRYIGNPILSFILRVFFKTRISDVHCGLRAFRTDALKKMNLRTTGMELASEIVIKSSLKGLKITEVPVTLHPDERGRPPHLKPFRDGWRHLRYMLLMAPNWLFIFPGSIMSLIGILIIGILLPAPLTIGKVTFDVHSMLLGMVLVLLGVYFIFIGLFVKVFTYVENLSIDSTGFNKTLTKFKLEHGLLATSFLIAIGLIGNILFLIHWKEKGFGDLNVQIEMRAAILYTTFLLVGLEGFFASFFLSM
ncbi:glycosyltransferase family 2 protein, partial [bacterium]|nr:glycosyltransferase family 2 protein [bacterium]